jgi:hypothetical protein
MDAGEFILVARRAIINGHDHPGGFALPTLLLSTARKPKHHRLWPLMFLPLLGLLAGLYVGIEQRRLPFDLGRLDPMSSAALGLLAGSGTMVISASIVLAYRIAQGRFTIGAILVTIAVIAVLLGWARALLV